MPWSTTIDFIRLGTYVSNSELQDEMAKNDYIHTFQMIEQEDQRQAQLEEPTAALFGMPLYGQPVRRKDKKEIGKTDNFYLLVHLKTDNISPWASSRGHLCLRAKPTLPKHTITNIQTDSLKYIIKKKYWKLSVKNHFWRNKLRNMNRDY